MTQLQKCCPSGYRLAVLNDGEQDELFNHNYRCLSSEGVVAEMFGYNLDVRNESMGIPQCSNVMMTDVDRVWSQVSIEGCIDTLNGKLIELRCPDYEHSVDLHRLMKCCPNGWAYDITDRRCVPNEQDMSVFQHLAGSSVVLYEPGTPKCNSEQVFVEYLSGHSHTIRLHQSAVDVVSMHHGESEHLNPKTFCVDQYFESNAYENEASTTEPNIDETVIAEPASYIIIRTCRPRSICNRIPCVRRCCRNEQMMKIGENGSVCVDYDRNIRPKFYDVKLPLDEHKQQMMVDPPGNLK